MPVPSTPPPPPQKNWKRRLGIGLLIASCIPICTIELVALLPLTATQAVTFGAIYLASGEICGLAAVALLGRPFIAAVKERVLGFFRRKAPAPPRPISRTRHRVGVALFVASILPYYAVLAVLLFGHPGESDIRTLLYLLLSGEVLFFVGLVVLGEEFWARLKRLFEWHGTETTPRS
ncbi:hypothetical protein [Desulfolutivibrio sulfoxidireducens]|uniref:hypothetical protein n=1 Tax=Desulfolutivibrio sulfoxidireducens TaxID=2773299 RepID=UPI00159D510E|nr:hypothetical protein [Desulfolutivibrio sulfoxidireducens]QLA15507.1 hypothetical protein GD605_04810 [Desulfolutivibrio sulfoxidireducens]QLA19105.1 hypothetical protein GD604_04825 [Desulfolutivibrio sulfoxidireducens]